MIESRTQSERSVVAVGLVVFVADGDHSGHGQNHGHVYGHDPQRLSRDQESKLLLAGRPPATIPGR